MLVPFYGNNIHDGCPRGAILSLSHQPAAGITNAILFGATRAQLAPIRDAIKSMSAIASHPVFLPTLICHFRVQRCLIIQCDQYVDLVNLEAASGLGNSLYYRGSGVETIPIGSCKDPNITKDAANTTVAAARSETEVESLALILSELQDFLRVYGSADRQTQIFASHLTTLNARVRQNLLRVGQCRTRLELQLTAVLRLLNKTRLEKVRTLLTDASRSTTSYP